METVGRVAEEILNRVSQTPLPILEQTVKAARIPDDSLFLELTRAGVSKRHIGASRETIDPKRWDLLKGFKLGESFFLYGKPGTGKTHIAAALIRDAIASRRGGMRLVTMTDLLMRIKATFSDYSDESEGSVIREYATETCLILDDIGVEKPTDWVLQTLYTIIDRRYRDMLQTVFTSNLNLSQLADKLGERIPSRIAEMCGPDNILHITGPDRRLERR